MKDDELIDAYERARLEVALQRRRMNALEQQIIDRAMKAPIGDYVVQERYGTAEWSVEESIVKFMLSGAYDIIGLKTPAACKAAGVEQSLLQPLTTRPYIGRYLGKKK